MAKIRVHEIAKQLDMQTKELIPIIHNLGIDIKSHLSKVDEEIIQKIKKELKIDENLKEKQIFKNNFYKKFSDKTQEAKDLKIVEKKIFQQKEQNKNDINKKIQDKKEFEKDLKSKNQVNTKKSFDKKNDNKNQYQDKNESYKNFQKNASLNKLNKDKNFNKNDSQNYKSNQNQLKDNQGKNFKNQILKNNYKNKSDIKDFELDDKLKLEKNHHEKNNDNKKTKNKNELRENKKFSDNFKSKNLKNKNNNFQDDGLTKTQRKKIKKAQRAKEQEIIDSMNEIIENVIQLNDRMTVADFANEIGKNTTDVILKLMNLGVMASINQYVDFDAMQLVAEEFNINVELKIEKIDEDIEDYDFEDDEKNLVKRAPVVTVMGHVDHGKTSLLDAIRATDITTTEAGGITQHIGASEVKINGEKIVFLDTPGHEAFTSLRARGAKVTDIAILVVAADDGVMPQTIEAIDHAKAADVPIIVAVNKIDKETANVDRVYKELAEHGVLVEEWGGDTVSVKVSAKKRQNIDGLLEMILIVSELLDLKANPNRNAIGTVIEANLDKGKGAVATILIQNGSLKVGDAFVCGTTVGKVRAMYNYKGKKIKIAGPSSAVEITGMNEIATAGDKFFGINTEKEAKQIAEKRANQIKQNELDKQGHVVTLEDIFNQIQEGKVKTLDLILKADVHGSLEAIKSSLMKLNTDEVKINIHHANIGAITESDIMLATASNTVVIGFNVRPSSAVIAMAKKEGVEIRTYQIIYNLINDIEAAMKGMLEPEYKEVQTAEVEVRATFKVPNVGVIAGGYVLSGKIERNSKIRLLRNGIIMYDGKLSSLKRFKDDVKEVASGYECGLGIDNFNDLKEGDIIEAYELKEIERELK